MYPILKECPHCHTRWLVRRPTSTSYWAPSGGELSAPKPYFYTQEVCANERCRLQEAQTRAVEQWRLDREADHARRAQLGAELLDHLRTPSFFNPTPAQTEFITNRGRRRLLSADFTTLALLDDAAIHAELNRWQAADGWKAPQ